MKLYTTFQLKKLVSIIDNTYELGILSEYIFEYNEHYKDKEFLSITDRIANKHKTLRRIKE
jgi:hypothetical protein